LWRGRNCQERQVGSLRLQSLCGRRRDASRVTFGLSLSRRVEAGDACPIQSQNVASRQLYAGMATHSLARQVLSVQGQAWPATQSRASLVTSMLVSADRGRLSEASSVGSALCEALRVVAVTGELVPSSLVCARCANQGRARPALKGSSSQGEAWIVVAWPARKWQGCARQFSAVPGQVRPASNRCVCFARRVALYRGRRGSVLLCVSRLVTVRHVRAWPAVPCNGRRC